MNSKVDYTILDLEQLSPLQAELDKIAYQSHEVVIHKGHIPRVALIVLHGPVQVKIGRELISLPQFAMIGLRELYHNNPLKFAVEVSEGAEVLSIDRSTILNHLNESGESKLSQLFNDIVIQSAV